MTCVIFEGCGGDLPGEHEHVRVVLAQLAAADGQRTRIPCVCALTLRPGLLVQIP
jgi:hypothetical protein